MTCKWIFAKKKSTPNWLKIIYLKFLASSRYFDRLRVLQLNPCIYEWNYRVVNVARQTLVQQPFRVDKRAIICFLIAFALSMHAELLNDHPHISYEIPSCIKRSAKLRGAIFARTAAPRGVILRLRDYRELLTLIREPQLPRRLKDATRKVKTRELVSPLIKVFALRLILELSGDLNIPCKLPANVGDY